MDERTHGGLASAVGLLTVVGGGRRAGAEAVGWFPVVGAALGTGLGAAWWAFGRVFPPLVAGGLVVAAGSLYSMSTASSTPPMASSRTSIVGGVSPSWPSRRSARSG